MCVVTLMTDATRSWPATQYTFLPFFAVRVTMHRDACDVQVAVHRDECDVRVTVHRDEFL